MGAQQNAVWKNVIIPPVTISLLKLNTLIQLAELPNTSCHVVSSSGTFWVKVKTGHHRKRKKRQNMVSILWMCMLYHRLIHWGRDKSPPFSRPQFEMHCHGWKCINLIKISLKFVRKSPINNIPALVQIMAWRRPGGLKQSCTTVYRCIYASFGINELNVRLRYLQGVIHGIPCIVLHKAIEITFLDIKIFWGDLLETNGVDVGHGLV